VLKIAMVAERGQLRARPDAVRTPHLVALCEALAGAGHEVTVVVRRDDGLEEDTARWPFAVLRRDNDLAGALASCRPDIVHGHSWSDGVAAANGARALDVPFVFTPHAASPKYESAVLPRVDHVLAVYTAQLPWLLAAGVSRRDISVVPCGVDVAHFTPDGDKADRRFPHRIVAVGEVTRSSGFGTAVAALPATPDAELVLVGTPQHGAHAAELRAYARALDVADRVHFEGGVQRADLPALVRSADLMVCNPWEPIFGRAALEAMACGIAVVTNGLGGLADTVVHGVTGTHVTPRKPRELAAALRRTLTRRAVCEQQGAAGRDRATARYAWDRIALETTHAYRRAGVADPAVLALEAAAAARKRHSRQETAGV
jgi:D-inositol-3-phosphate glycosyltransferase